MINISMFSKKIWSRKTLSISVCLVMIFSLVNFVQPTVHAAASDIYVATTGSDSNSGTVESPFKTILKASQVATPGTTVHVAPGNYTGGFVTTKSGTESARVRYVSDVKWGARIVPPSSATIWDNRGNYVDIEGFEFDGSGTDSRSGIYIGGSYCVVKNNHVHNIANTIPVSSSGGSAIGTDHYYWGVFNDVIDNVVHDIGYAGNNFVQGIYISTSGAVKNNLVYNVGACGIHLWHDATNVTIANNTVTSCGTAIVVGSGDKYKFKPEDKNDYTNVSNNIIYDNIRGIQEHGTTGIHNTYTNNLVYNNQVYDFYLLNGLTHSGTINADPQFVNYNTNGSGDFHVKYTSSAIDAGSPTYAPSTDLDGYSRPDGSGYDIGAYEYSADRFSINASLKSIRVGETTQIISSADLSTAQYVSESPSIATVDGNGVVTALSNGVANITATITSGKSSIVQITVEEHLQSVTLQTSDPNLEAGQTQQFTVTGVMTDGSAADLSKAKIAYRMNSSTVATVNQAGLVTGKSSGMETLYVEVTLKGWTKSTSTVVTVNPATLASVDLTVLNNNGILVKGMYAQLKLSGTSTNGKPASMSLATIAYRSSNPDIATVSSSGLVTGVAQGTAIITADVTLNGTTVSGSNTFNIYPGIAAIYQFTKLPIVSKTAEIKIYSPTLQFEAVNEGPSITFGFNVPETHMYQIALKTFKATSYGKYSIKIDGQPLSEYNFYGSTGAGTTFDPIGKIQLTTGDHEITFVNIGKNPESTNYKMGIIELQMLSLPEIATLAAAVDQFEASSELHDKLPIILHGILEEALAEMENGITDKAIEYFGDFIHQLSKEQNQTYITASCRDILIGYTEALIQYLSER